MTHSEARRQTTARSRQVAKYGMRIALVRPLAAQLAEVFNARRLDPTPAKGR